MTEAEWLGCTNARELVQFVADKVSDRKLRLFALAACVSSWRGVGPKRREMFAVTEAFVEGAASVQQVRQQWGAGSGLSWPEQSLAWALGVARTRSPVQKDHVAALARCIFGNPFKPVALLPAWISTTVVALAQAAYEERHSSRKELDLARLAVLADALEEAGCPELTLLAHLRGAGPHVRGCWALDLILSNDG